MVAVSLKKKKKNFFFFFFFYFFFFFFFFFFFKQKTAYEIVVRDWSSDVCSSDLMDHTVPTLPHSALQCEGSGALESAMYVPTALLQDRKSVV